MNTLQPILLVAFAFLGFFELLRITAYQVVCLCGYVIGFVFCTWPIWVMVIIYYVIFKE